MERPGRPRVLRGRLAKRGCSRHLQELVPDSKRIPKESLCLTPTNPNQPALNDFSGHALPPVGQRLGFVRLGHCMRSH